MITLVTVLHVMVCLALIFIVLLQHGRGAEMGSGFGSGSNQTIFGSTGAGTFLGKITTIAAVAFMLTSLTLAILSTQRSSSSRIIKQPAPAAAPRTGAPAVPPSPPAQGQ